MCFTLCLHRSAFACGYPNGPCVACVCYGYRAAWLCELLHSMRVLIVVLVVYHVVALEVRCWSYRYQVAFFRRIRLRGALFALCCSSLLIAAPVWILFLSLVICAPCLFAAILLANLILVSVFFIFMRYSADEGFMANLQDPSLRLMAPHLVDIVLESSAANTAYKYSNGWQR